MFKAGQSTRLNHLCFFWKGGKKGPEGGQREKGSSRSAWLRVEVRGRKAPVD